MIRVIPLFTHRSLPASRSRVLRRHYKVIDFTYVDDCVEGIMRGIQGLPGARCETSRSTSPRPISLFAAVAELIKKKKKKKKKNSAPPLLGEVTRYVADIGRARGLLDWEPSVPLETGIARSVAWFNEWRETHSDEDRALELDGSASSHPKSQRSSSSL